MRAPKTYRPISPVTDRERETICNAVDQSVAAIARVALVERFDGCDRKNSHIDPKRDRNAVLGKICCIIRRRIEITHFFVYTIRCPIGPAAAQVPCECALKPVCGAVARTGRELISID